MILGTLDPTDRRATVVGGGIAGLLTARALDHRGYEVTLLERAPRVGGLLSTARTQWGMSESAAHSLVATPAVERLCAELEVPLAPLERRGRARYVVRDGRLRRYPLTALETLGAARRLLFTRARERGGDQTMEEFATRHLGAAARDYLVTPMLAGIYGARPGDVGVKAAFPRFEVAEGRTALGTFFAPANKKPRGKMVVPRQGMGDLIDRLEHDLRRRLGARLQKAAHVDRLPDSPNIVLCVPAAEAARLLASVDSRAAAALAEVRYAPLLSATVFVERARLGRGVEGVGALIPARENRRILGVLFNSSAFQGRVRSPDSMVSFTVMLGGTFHPELLGLNDRDVSSLINKELGTLLDLRGKPEGIVIHRHAQALPLYSPGLVRTWDSLRGSWCAQPGRMLFGNYTGQISIRGMIEALDGGCF